MDVAGFAVSVVGSVGAAAAFIAAYSWRAGARIATIERDLAAAKKTADDALRIAQDQEAAGEVMAERLKNDRERQAERWVEMKETLAEIRRAR